FFLTTPPYSLFLFKVCIVFLLRLPVGFSFLYRTRYSAEGWWEPLIMGTAGVRTQEFSTGMVGTPHNGHSRCTDPGTWHRDGGNPS
ncbi:unnamed protein product, partial [Staurois parvus]